MAWNDLTIAQRSQLMNKFRHLGITDLTQMRQTYDAMSPLSSLEGTNDIRISPAPMYENGGTKKSNTNKLGRIPVIGPIAKRAAYKIITHPEVWKNAGATTKAVVKGLMQTNPMEDTNKKEFLYGLNRKPTTDKEAYTWEKDIRENDYGYVPSYEGILNPYNEYIINERDRGLVEELAKHKYSTSLNINDEYTDPNTGFIYKETPYFDDVHGYRIRFHNDEKGNPVISASDLYDFGKNYSKDFAELYEERTGNKNAAKVLEWQRRLLNSVGTPYKLVQHDIPIKFTNNPQGNEIQRTNSFTQQVLDTLSDQQIADITESGYITPSYITEHQKAKGGTIHKFDDGGSNKTVYGYPIIDAKKEGLEDYFTAHPEVAGMAIGAGMNGIEGQRRVVLNPQLDSKAKDSVYKNESYRHYFDENNIVLPTLTEEQRHAYNGTPYEGLDTQIQRTEAARYLSGDPSHHLTEEQKNRLKGYNFIYPIGYPLYESYSDGGSIHIEPENKGKFNATKARTGKTTEELTHSKNPLTRKRAIFAQNAAKWNHKHEDGGLLHQFGEGGLGLMSGFPAIPSLTMRLLNPRERRILKLNAELKKIEEEREQKRNEYLERQEERQKELKAEMEKARELDDYKRNRFNAIIDNGSAPIYILRSKYNGTLRQDLNGNNLADAQETDRVVIGYPPINYEERDLGDKIMYRSYFNPDDLNVAPTWRTIYHTKGERPDTVMREGDRALWKKIDEAAVSVLPEITLIYKDKQIKPKQGSQNETMAFPFANGGTLLRNSRKWKHSHGGFNF